jgi:hypothetical protein
MLRNSVQTASARKLEKTTKEIEAGRQDEVTRNK